MKWWLKKSKNSAKNKAAVENFLGLQKHEYVAIAFSSPVSLDGSSP